MKSMGVASGYCCKEVYRFPRITYPYSSYYLSLLLLLLIPTPLISVLFCSNIPNFF